MITHQPDLFVIRTDDAHQASRAEPLTGFSNETAYRVLGLDRPSETGVAYVLLADDYGEMRFVASDRFRAYQIVPGATDLRRPVRARMASGDGASEQGVVLCDGRDHGTPVKAAAAPAKTGCANAL